jgi:hypothetical protein
MDNDDRIIQQWIESAEAAAVELAGFLATLLTWRRMGERVDADELHAALKRLRDAGLEGWADRNPAGGGLDALAEALQGKGEA